MLFRNKIVLLLRHFYLYDTKTIKINLMNRVFLLIIMFVASCYANAQVVRTVELTKDDDLAALLGNEKYQIDAIVVNGYLSHANISVLNDCSEKGMLRKIDMSGCVVENDSIPKYGFGGACWHVIKLPRNLRVIGHSAFYRSHIRTIDFPSTLRRIEDEAFLEVPFDDIIIPEGVEEIGYNAFYGCTNARKIQLPSSLKVIKDCAFWGCGSKVSSELILSEGLEYIGKGAFIDMSITEVNIPSTVVYLGMAAFSLCENLQRVKLPENLEKIKTETFYNCCLQEIIWPEKLREIETNGIGHVMIKCLELPEGLTTIDEKAIVSNHTEKLILPATLNTLAYNAFSLCTAIKEVYAKSAVPPILDINGSVVPFPKDAVLYVPVGSRDAYLNTFCRGEFKEIIETENFPTSIGGVMTGDVTYGVSGKNGAISITNNGKASTPYYIYTADGKVYNNGVAERGTVTVNAGKGLYVVRIGNSTDKIILK